MQHMGMDQNRFSPKSEAILGLTRVPKVLTHAAYPYVNLYVKQRHNFVLKLLQIRSGMTENRARQFWELRRHLRKNRVSITLSARIQKYVEHVLESHQAAKSPNTLHKDAQSQSDDVRCPFQETINKLNKTKGPKDTKSKALL